MSWHVYLVRCADGTLYTGVTTDLERRLAAHNGGRGAAYTRARRPVTLVHAEPAADRPSALRREWAIKQLPRAAKEALVRPKRSQARPLDAKAPERFAGFRPEALRFLRRLTRNNRRDWFEAHRTEWEREVRDPMRALVEEMDVRLARLAPELVGDPRRSVFRIHRDVRFSADKSPYKTWAACQFYHRDAGRGAGTDAVGAGAALYFQLADADSFVAGGIWMPARPALAQIRERIADAPEELEALLAAPAFRRRYRRLDEEAMLTRMPRGWRDDHPAARWLRYRSFTATHALTERELLGPRLADRLERDFTTLVPLLRWLNAALGYAASDRRL